MGGLLATFTGGVILTNETGQAVDSSNVYATATLATANGDPSLTNPLVVTFSQPIQNFQIDILNGLAGDYLMSDNSGHSVPFNLAGTGSSRSTQAFAAAGTEIRISFLTAPQAWDFAIDNIAFNQPLTIPEPTPAAFAAAGLVLLIGRSARRCFGPER